jgi:predicted nucleic acid-binding protein
VYAPPQVVAELGFLWPGWQTPAWIKVNQMDESHAAEADAWVQAELLHLGEAEAIALAQQLGAEWLLTDDSAARLFASELGLEVHGSLGVVLWGVAVGHLDRPAAEAALAQLAASSLWLSSRILAEARAAIEEIFRPESP